MRTVFAQAPLRIGFSGGGTDVAPYRTQFGGAVVTCSISKFVYTRIFPISDPRFELCSLDQETQLSFTLSDARLSQDSLARVPSAIKLHLATHQWIIETYLDGKTPCIRVETFSEAPTGSGLGGSSTLVVSLLTAYSRYFDLELQPEETASAAFYIEREICGFAGGLQDQYASAFGGLNFLKFGPGSGVEVEPIKVPNGFIERLNASLLMLNTGISRHSATIITNQQEKMSRGSESVADFDRLKQSAFQMRDAIESNDIDRVAELMFSAWAHKRATSTKVSNSDLDRLIDIAIENGALAGKVSGAGGGGFLLFMTPVSKRKNVIDSLVGQKLTPFPAVLTKQRATAWIE